MGKSLFKLLFVLMLVGTVQIANAQEPYAVLSENNTVLTFYYDGDKVSKNGYGIGPFELNDTRWGGNSSNITKVVFDSSFKNCTSITSTAYWFFGCYYLATIEGIDNLKTGNVVDMTAMFADCRSLTSLTLWNFDTSNVTNMSSMFQDCSGLVDLTLEWEHTEKVTDMSCMFRGCKKLGSLMLTHFNTKNVTNMWCMFYDCTALVVLDIYYFDTSNVTNMNSMFQDCSSIDYIDLRGFNTEKVTNMGQMFDGCSKLKKLDMSKFNTQNVTNFQCLFMNCAELTTLDLSTFNTAQVEHMGQVFEGCSKLQTIYVDKDKWTTSAVTFGPRTFDGCTSLIGGAGTAYNAEQIDYTYARIDGGASNPGYFTAKGGGGESPTEETEETEETIKITSAGQTTWCSASDLDFTGVDGLKAYIAPGYNRTTGTIWLMRVFEVPANEGILLMGDPGEYKVPKKSTTTYYKNMFKGTLEPITINETDGEYTNYYLSNGTSGVGFYKVEGTRDIGANRAYLPLLKGTTQAGTRFIGFEFGDGTTSVKEVKSGEVKGEKWFTLQGQRVTKPAKGLYIKNGKKVIVR